MLGMDRNKDVFDYEYDDETGTIEVNMLGSVYGASIEDYPEVMSRVVNILQEVPDASSVVLSESRDYEYGEDQVKMLKDISEAIRDISSQGYLSESIRTDKCESLYQEHLPQVQRIVVDQMRKDPVGAYVELKRKQRHMKQQMDEAYPQQKRCMKYFIQDVVNPVREKMEECEMIEMAMGEEMITGHHVGDREVYREFFHPLVRPNFMLTKFMSLPPERGEEIDRYKLDNDVEVSVYEVPDQVQPVYHVNPPEFNLSEEKYRLLDAARRFLASHQPESGEFARPERMRQVFQNIGRDMIRDIAQQMDVRVSGEEMEQLASILNRYTSGLGVLEILLSDPKIQDVFINSPIGNAPIFVKHQEYEECETNLIPTKEEAEGWATRFRIQSGRPLDEANPVLDTDTEVPGGRARVAIIQENLSPEGLAFAFRRHRSKAWTLPLFIKSDFINPLGAGLLSFIVDGNRSVLFAGTRGAGKTSLLSASMLELLKKERIVTVEDSVTGDTPILYRKDGEVKYGEIGEMVDGLLERKDSVEERGREILRGNPEGIEVLSMSEDGELKWSESKLFMAHDVEKPIYEVETRTGREIKVTGDHSLFGMSEDFKMREVKPKNLEEGDHVVTPRELEVPEQEKEVNLIDRAAELDGYFRGDLDLDDSRNRLKDLAEEYDYSEHTVNYWIREDIIPAKVLAELDEEFGSGDLIYKHKRQSSELPAGIELDEKMMEFFGLWMADGCYDNRSVLVTVSDEECRRVVRQVFERFGLPVKIHSDEHTLVANSQPLKEVMKLFGFEGDAYSKRVPEWIFSAEENQRHAFLRGLYSGDGYSTEDEIGIDLINEDLIEDVQTLLLIDGIRGRARDSGKMRSMRISDLKGLEKFKNKIGFLQDHKSGRIDLENKESTHDTTDIIPLPRDFKKKICDQTRLRANDYVGRDNSIGRRKLKQVSEISRKKIVDRISHLADSDIFWDQVKSIEKVSEQERVYDISVPGDENFVAGNILAHNTLELPIRQMKDLGFNIESMKSRSVITEVENELPAEEAIRTSLRLGDSALVIGEVRSDEAKTLYEAMRVGAVANFVGGTIHGESAYSVFDRVVNDLNVPRTSFKATDIIVSVNKIESPSGLDTYRRVTGITEVRKEWTDDPQEEGAFVDLMRYDSNEDELVPTDTLKNGESDILNRIAENTSGWKNDWEAVWNNIKLRQRIKKAIVEKADETGNDDLLEAEFTVRANQRFHILANRVEEEYGNQDPERIYARWEEWLDQQVG
ncbi:MAG: ATPase, T2SS/T4P/T4SS family [Candidatus Nanohaloarchaea archaeon]